MALKKRTTKKTHLDPIDLGSPPLLTVVPLVVLTISLEMRAVDTIMQSVGSSTIRVLEANTVYARTYVWFSLGEKYLG